MMGVIDRRKLNEYWRKHDVRGSGVRQEKRYAALAVLLKVSKAIYFSSSGEPEFITDGPLYIMGNKIEKFGGRERLRGRYRFLLEDCADFYMSTDERAWIESWDASGGDRPGCRVLDDVVARFVESLEYR